MAMEDAEGARLLARIAARDQDAMMQFYDGYFGLVAGLCRRVVRDAEAADETIQDVFWQVWKTASGYRAERGRVHTWLLVMARSRCLDALRRAGARLPADSLDERDAESLAAPDDVAAEAAARWQQRDVRRAFRGLPVNQRQAVESVYFGGMTADEVAHLQAVPVGTVKTRIRLGLQKLRSVLEGESDGA